jgi:hypothetical protein
MTPTEEIERMAHIELRQPNRATPLMHMLPRAMVGLAGLLSDAAAKHGQQKDPPRVTLNGPGRTARVESPGFSITPCDHSWLLHGCGIPNTHRVAPFADVWAEGLRRCHGSGVWL